jgi:Flp pilus assembly protein TadB
MKLSYTNTLHNLMSYNNEKLPWIFILAGGAILTLRLIVALFSSLSIVDWFAIIIITSGLVLLIINNNN